MPGKEAVIKTASLIAAAAMFITGAVLFYQHTESGSESSTKRTAIDSMSSAASVTADEASSDTAAYPMDINKATLGDFMNVDGIGEVIAGRITAYRAEVGVIHDIAELSEIEGIGDELCRLIAEHFYVDEKDYAPFTTATVTKLTTSKPATTTTRKTTKATTTAPKVVFPIDINKVTKDELMQIGGVGEGLADKITALRIAKGKITDMEQLLEIYGIGQTTYEMLCGYLYVDSADYSKASTTAVTTKAATTSAKTAPPKTTTTTSQSEVQRQKRKVNINTASAAEIADALLIDSDTAKAIVTLRDKLGGFSNTLELLYLDEIDPKYDTAFYNSIKDHICV